MSRDHGSRMFPFKLECLGVDPTWHMSADDARQYGRNQGYKSCTVEKLCDDGEYRGCVR